MPPCLFVAALTIVPPDTAGGIRGPLAASTTPIERLAHSNAIHRNAARSPSPEWLFCRRLPATIQKPRRPATSWSNAIVPIYHAIVFSVVLRAGSIIAMMALVFVLSEVWRRMTFRYVHDAASRRQFLLVRRFATGALMIIVIILGFISDFSSLATFAGVITAGIAVALQTILLSIAAFFFMIGRAGRGRATG